MKKPDENYDWNHAIGKMFHDFTSYGSRPSPTARGVITKKSKSRVYYTSMWTGAGESWCDERTISLVEVGEDETQAIAKAYRQMNDGIASLKDAYLKTIEDMSK